jgi:predicted dehydrogenase
MHCEWTVRAAEAGKHVLCEKPLAVSAEECQRMIDAANANNVVLVEAFTHRWNPHLRKARQLVAEGAIGEIQTVDSALCFNVIEPDGNIRFSKALAGGALRDAGSYAVYAIRFVMSAEPTHVIGYSHDSGNWGVDTTFAGTMKFSNGAIGNITTNMKQPFRCFITIHGSAGQIEIPNMFDDSGPIVIKKGDGRTSQDDQVIAVQAPNRFLVQLDEFTQCVLTGEKPEFPAEDGLANTTVLEALYESANAGASVSLGL